MRNLDYTVIRETEKAFLIEFDTYKGVKEELVKLKTWIPKVWVELNKVAFIEGNMEKVMVEHFTKLNTWLKSKFFNQVKYSLTKSEVVKPTHKKVNRYIDASFFQFESNGATNSYTGIWPSVSNASEYDNKSIMDLVLEGKGFFYKEARVGWVSDKTKFFNRIDFCDDINVYYENKDKDIIKERNIEILLVKDIKIFKNCTKSIKNNFLQGEKVVKID